MRVPVDKSFLRFLIVGALNLAIGSALIFGLYNICGFGYWISSVAAYAVAIPFSFFLNKWYSFKNDSSGMGQMLKFVIHIFICYTIAYGAAKCATGMFFHSLRESLSENIALGLGTCFFIALNYLGQKLFIFKTRNVHARMPEHSMESINTDSEAKNKDFFTSRHETYKNVMSSEGMSGIRLYTDDQIRGGGINTLCDIGNSGVFNYDPNSVSSITAVDLFFEDKQDETRPHIMYKRGNALNLPFPDESFDGVLLSCVLHHLTGADYSENYRNILQSMEEAKRILVKGGKCVIIEPTLPRFMVMLEKPAYPLVAWLINRYCVHPPAFHYDSSTIGDAVQGIFGNVRQTHIPISGVGTFLDFVVPVWLLPHKVFGYAAIKK